MSSNFDFFPWFRNFTINPQTDWQRFINPQFNVTVNQGDAAVENHVLARAGSYGKQIGRMQQVLDILVARLPPEELTAVERRSIDKYHETRGAVVAAVDEAQKEQGDASIAPIDVGRWLDELAALRDKDPERYERDAERLREFLAGDADSGNRQADAGSARMRAAPGNESA